jgi:hypothetical protein
VVRGLGRCVRRGAVAESTWPCINVDVGVMTSS